MFRYHYTSHEAGKSHGYYYSVADAHEAAQRAEPPNSDYSVWLTTGEHVAQRVEYGKVSR